MRDLRDVAIENDNLCVLISALCLDDVIGAAIWDAEDSFPDGMFELIKVASFKGQFVDWK